MSPCIRQNRVIIRIHGEDAEKLLNDVLTVEFKKDETIARWWALLSPQGKVQAEGLGRWFDNAFWLDVHNSVADAFLKRMKLYRLRAKVEFDDLRASHIIGWSEEKPDASKFFADPRNNALGFHIIAPIDETIGWLDDCSAFKTARIAFGIGELGEDFDPDKLFPHNIGMDLLSGVDFSKGCYVGQEVVSRMQHKTEVRRRPLIADMVEAPSFSQLLNEGKEIGILGQVVNKKVIAYVRLDKIGDGKTIMAGDSPIRLTLPDWANYHFNESVKT